MSHHRKGWGSPDVMDHPPDAPLGTYREIPSGPLCYINRSDITKVLKYVARVHGAEFGIRPDDVSAGYLCSTGAMALFCGGVESSRIRLLGRWKSWTMLRYLHPSMRARLWVWRSSAYYYIIMELPMMRLWGHTKKPPLALCATSRLATSPRP